MRNLLIKKIIIMILSKMKIIKFFKIKPFNNKIKIKIKYISNINL